MCASGVQLPRDFKGLRKIYWPDSIIEEIARTHYARLVQHARRAMKREWWICFEAIPRDCFVSAKVTGAPWWLEPDDPEC